MFKNKIFWVVTVAFLLSCNFCCAVENVNITCPNRYPDYAYEFTGKDTCEKFNRKLFIFNLKLNKCVIRPINIVWASVVPKYGIERIQNLYSNSNFMVRVVGSALQKDFKASRQEFKRFLINSTMGIAGLYDPAKNIFKIEPRQEDIEQVLAHYNVKKGPYLVLPIVRGNIRDLVGQLLDCPLRPTSYIPIAGSIATAVFSINNSTNVQPLIKKIDESYADPYEIARQIDGISGYIKAQNLDREEVLNEKSKEETLVKLNNPVQEPEIRLNPVSDLKSDVELANFNPQGPLIDSMRTAFFETQKKDDSKWSELSVWNRSFGKSIKTGYVKVFDKRQPYKYRYVLQKNKISPLAIIYPSIGEGSGSDGAAMLAKILYGAGYSVIIQGSAFQWEFVKSMPVGYKPGLPQEDAHYLRMVSAKIVTDLSDKKSYKFGRKILVGTSFGAMTGLFTAAQEQDEDTLGISKYSCICPPVKLFFSLKQLDKDCSDWKCSPVDIKLRAAVTAEKVVNSCQKVSGCTVADLEKNKECLPFNEDEAKLVIGFIMKQKLSDVVFSVENGCRGKKCALYDGINKMSFDDYANKYLFVKSEKTIDQYDYETSLYSLNNFLQSSPKYKIYHAIDDYFVNPEQLKWLKQRSGSKALIFSNGSHLGFLYRKEFLDSFEKEIRFDETPLPGKL